MLQKAANVPPLRKQISISTSSQLFGALKITLLFIIFNLLIIFILFYVFYITSNELIIITSIFLSLLPFLICSIFPDDCSPIPLQFTENNHATPSSATSSILPLTFITSTLRRLSPLFFLNSSLLLSLLLSLH